MKKITIWLKRSLCISLACALSLQGCSSTPANPVPVAQVGDETKSCNAITNEMQEMITAQEIAKGEKNTQTGTNAALGVAGIFLIVPWFFMDLGGAASAEQKAAQARFKRLQQMGIDRKCTGVPVMSPETSTTQDKLASDKVQPSQATESNSVKRLNDLNLMLKNGLISQKEYDLKKAEILKNL
jgi:hypothetical protein